MQQWHLGDDQYAPPSPSRTGTPRGQFIQSRGITCQHRRMHGTGKKDTQHRNDRTAGLKPKLMNMHHCRENSSSISPDTSILFAVHKGPQQSSSRLWERAGPMMTSQNDGTSRVRHSLSPAKQRLCSGDTGTGGLESPLI